MRGSKTVQRAQQTALFSPKRQRSATDSGSCEIVAVGRRRDGGTRYWCLAHKSDGTAKYGTPAEKCRAADIPPITARDVFTLDLDKYGGGVALWGAVPPVYDTSIQPADRGIHVHARPSVDAQKEVDRTYRAVRLKGQALPKEGVCVNELDAIYYMVSSIFGYPMSEITCTYCGYSHLDRDWFSIHPHRRHLCAGCGRYFRDSAVSVGNPICGVREACGVSAKRQTPSKKKFVHRQGDFPGGIQVWGSNPAFLWTADREEEDGIHIHAFTSDDGKPDEDDTFGVVIIDGVRLDAAMVRTFMAQSALPHIAGRVISSSCPSCGTPAFSIGDLAFTPVSEHECASCGVHFCARGRLRKTIANPLPAILEDLGRRAPRKPRWHVMDLLPETL
jgi:hypothetical protein